ncbi:MAG: hypothetical protein C4293_21220, partial [Nitrospiraceae bacterium]
GADEQDRPLCNEELILITTRSDKDLIVRAGALDRGARSVVRARVCSVYDQSFTSCRIRRWILQEWGVRYGSKPARIRPIRSGPFFLARMVLRHGSLPLSHSDARGRHYFGWTERMSRKRGENEEKKE